MKLVLYVLAESVRALGVHISSVMPSTPARIWAQLGVADESAKTWESVQKFGCLKPGTQVKKGEALFPRVDIKKELEELNKDKLKEQPKAPEEIQNPTDRFTPDNSQQE